MKPDKSPSLNIVPAGAQNVRFEVQLTRQYRLVGEYVNGVLHDLTLVGNSPREHRPAKEA